MARKPKPKSNNKNNNNSKSSSGFDMSNFGFLGGVGAGVSCDANDDSFFCQLTKFTSTISQLIFLISILVMVYFAAKVFVFPMIFGKRGQRGGRLSK